MEFSLLLWLGEPPNLAGLLLSAIDINNNKNYYVVGDAGFTRPRNPLKIISNFFLINQSINESINEQGIPRTAHPPSKSFFSQGKAVWIQEPFLM